MIPTRVELEIDARPLLYDIEFRRIREWRVRFIEASISLERRVIPHTVVLTIENGYRDHGHYDADVQDGE